MIELKTGQTPCQCRCLSCLCNRGLLFRSCSEDAFQTKLFSYDY